MCFSTDMVGHGNVKEYLLELQIKAGVLRTSLKIDRMIWKWKILGKGKLPDGLKIAVN